MTPEEILRSNGKLTVCPHFGENRTAYIWEARFEVPGLYRWRYYDSNYEKAIEKAYSEFKEILWKEVCAYGIDNITIPDSIIPLRFG